MIMFDPYLFAKTAAARAKIDAAGIAEAAPEYPHGGYITEVLNTRTTETG